MFSIRLRPRNRTLKGSEEASDLCIYENEEFSTKDNRDVFRFTGSPDTPLLEASFSSLSSSSSSSSSEEEDDNFSTSTAGGRRVSFLLKEHHHKDNNRRSSAFANRRKMFQETKGKASSSSSSLNLSFLRRSSQRSVLRSENIKSVKPLLRGEIPLAKIVIREDPAEVSTPGNRLWMVGTLPDTDETAPSCQKIAEEEEELPFDEIVDRRREQESMGPFDEHVRCRCCKSSAAVTCVTCNQVKVQDDGNGKWTVGTHDQQVSVSLPPDADMQAELPRDLVIDSDFVLDDIYFCLDEKSMPQWNAESLLLVLFQLLVLKVSTSM